MNERASRDGLIDAILAFLGDQDLLAARDIRQSLEREIDSAAPDALETLKTRLSADNGWGYSSRDPLAQRIHHVLADRFLDTASTVAGIEHVAAAGGAPVAVCANHLSYSDANVVEVLLQRSGCAALANRLTAVAGPKVFSSRERRFSSLCFGTIKVPQSHEVASEDAVMSSRDVARAARRAIDAALERFATGDALLLFGEGTRSRNARLQPMLPGVARYLEMPGSWVLPAGLSGSEQLFPVERSRLRPARVTLRFGRRLQAHRLFDGAEGDRRLVMDAVGLAVAEVLPLPYRGVYADPERYPDAGRLLSAARD